MRQLVAKAMLSKMGFTTLEERRHHADMAIVFKILTENKEEVDPTIWFGMATGVTRVTRIAADRRLTCK